MAGIRLGHEPIRDPHGPVGLIVSTRDVPDQIGDLPRIGRPANSALLGVGVTSLDEAAAYGRHGLLALHGVGPRAIRLIEEALDAQGRSLEA